MTEDEAKLRWCPFASSRVVSYERKEYAICKTGEDHPTPLCIGDGCMAWRDTRDTTGRKYGGYCGLAGKP